MLKVSDDDIGSKFMEDSRVENSNKNMIHSRIRSQKKEKAVLHYSKPYIYFGMAFIS